MNALSIDCQANRVLPILVFIVLLTSLAALATADTTTHSPLYPEGDPDFIAPWSQLQLVVRGHDFGIVFTEGPAVSCDGKVYFSDITPSASFASKTTRGGTLTGVIWVYNPLTFETKVFRSPSGMSNGLMFDADCNLLSAEGADFGGRRITQTDMQTGVSQMIAGLYDDLPLNSPNDLAIDEQDRVYFTDPRYMGNEAILLDMAVYRIDPDGSIHQIITDIGTPNGLAISPDQQTLYVVDTGTTVDNVTTPGRILAYNLNADGSVNFRNVVVEYEVSRRADGMTVDADGNLWVAVQDSRPNDAQRRQGIFAYTPTGEEKAYIPLYDRPRNVTFARDTQNQVLYITAGNDLYRINVVKHGYQLPQH